MGTKPLFNKRTPGACLSTSITPSQVTIYKKTRKELGFGGRGGGKDVVPREHGRASTNRHMERVRRPWKPPPKAPHTRKRGRKKFSPQICVLGVYEGGKMPYLGNAAARRQTDTCIVFGAFEDPSRRQVRNIWVQGQIWGQKIGCGGGVRGHRGRTGRTRRRADGRMAGAGSEGPKTPGVDTVAIIAQREEKGGVKLRLGRSEGERRAYLGN